MKQFILEVPEGNTDDCNKCPCLLNENVCRYINENGFCIKYDFTKAQIEEYDENNIM